MKWAISMELLHSKKPTHVYECMHRHRFTTDHDRGTLVLTLKGCDILFSDKELSETVYLAIYQSWISRLWQCDSADYLRREPKEEKYSAGVNNFGEMVKELYGIFYFEELNRDFMERKHDLVALFRQLGNVMSGMS
jgi:hypothetical protein